MHLWINRKIILKSTETRCGFVDKYVGVSLTEKQHWSSRYCSKILLPMCGLDGPYLRVSDPLLFIFGMSCRLILVLRLPLVDRPSNN